MNEGELQSSDFRVLFIDYGVLRVRLGEIEIDESHAYSSTYHISEYHPSR